MTDRYAYKSCIPASTSKTQRSDCGGWGKGLGNNVSNQGNKHARNFNAMAANMATSMDAPNNRKSTYANVRRTDAYKLARAEAKRSKKRAKFGASDASQDRDMPIRGIDCAYLDVLGECRVKKAK